MASEFGKYLTRHLKSSGLGTQLALSKAIDMDYGQLNKIFTGKTQRPEIETLQKIAPAIGRPIEEVMQAAGYPAPETKQQSNVKSVTPLRRALTPSALMQIGRIVADAIEAQASIDNGITSFFPAQYEATDEDEDEMVDYAVFDAFAADRMHSSGRQVQERIKVPTRLLRLARVPLVILITGDCLALRGIIKGDHLLIDGAITNPSEGDIVAFRWRGEASVKVWYLRSHSIPRPTAGLFRLVSTDATGCSLPAT